LKQLPKLYLFKGWESISYMLIISLSYLSCISLPDAAYFHLYGIERDDVDYIMGTFRVMKEEDEKLYREYRTKRVILEIYYEMRRAMETGEVYRTRLVPVPGDRAVAHEGRMGVDVHA
jgi:hypothetical protein